MEIKGELSPNVDFEEDIFVVYGDDSTRTMPVAKHSTERRQFQAGERHERDCQVEKRGNSEMMVAATTNITMQSSRPLHPRSHFCIAMHGHLVAGLMTRLKVSL